MAEKLHGLGIIHEDLEPRNVVRTIAGGFSILDFTESRMHNCKEKKPVKTHGFNCKSFSKTDAILVEL